MKQLETCLTSQLMLCGPLLIGACRIHRNTEIGEWAAKKLLEMKPKNPGYNVLITSTCAAAGCWNKLAKINIIQTSMYWQLLKLIYHAPVIAGYHQSVWNEESKTWTWDPLSFFHKMHDNI